MVPALLFCRCYCCFLTCFYIITASVDVAYTGIYNNYSMATLSEADFVHFFVWNEQKSVVDYHTVSVLLFLGGNVFLKLLLFLKKAGGGGGGAVEGGGGGGGSGGWVGGGVLEEDGEAGVTSHL